MFECYQPLWIISCRKLAWPFKMPTCHTLANEADTDKSAQALTRKILLLLLLLLLFLLPSLNLESSSLAVFARLGRSSTCAMLLGRPWRSVDAYRCRQSLGLLGPSFHGHRHWDLNRYLSGLRSGICQVDIRQVLVVADAALFISLSNGWWPGHCATHCGRDLKKNIDDPNI